MLIPTNWDSWRRSFVREGIIPTICLFLAVVASVTPCFADRMVSVDMGYFGTGTKKYGSGLVYGLGLTEGRGKIGFGITALRLANRYNGDTTTVTPEGKIHTTGFEETIADFYMTILATYRLDNANKTSRLMLGAGPQIHFVNSSIQIGDVKLSGRSSRLGLGVILRYQRRIEMFGKTALVLTGAYSYRQSVVSHTDQYEPPRDSVNIGTVTAGLAFPF